MMTNIRKIFKKYPEAYLLPIFVVVFIILQGIATRGWNPARAPYPKNLLEINGSIKIAWYAVFIITGIIFAVVMAVKEVEKLDISKDALLTGVLFIVPSSIIGARLYYVLFDANRSYHSFTDVINLTDGGLAIHGALITAAVLGLIYCLIKKISIIKILDLIAIGFLFGQISGRWGNFINQEAYGPLINPADPLNPGFLSQFPFAPFMTAQMKINGQLVNGASATGYFHPTFLYESMLNLLMLIFLLVIRRFRVLKVGDMFGLYLIWYGLVRGLAIEPIRQDPLIIGNSEVNIVLSLTLLALGGIIYLIVKNVVFKNIEFYFDASQHVGSSSKKTKKSDKIDLVIFDLDGTLLNTKDAIFKSIDYSFEVNNIDNNLTDSDKLSFLGPTLEESYSKYFSDKKLVDKLIKDYRHHNLEYHNKGFIKSFDNAKVVLKQLKKSGYKIAVATSKKTDVAKLGLEKTNLLQFIDVVIGFDEITKYKPDPEVLNKVLSHFNIKPTNAVYIGDMPTDIIAAKTINMPNIGVKYSDKLELLEHENPDYLVNNLLEIEKILMEV